MNSHTRILLLSVLSVVVVAGAAWLGSRRNADVSTSIGAGDSSAGPQVAPPGPTLSATSGATRPPESAEARLLARITDHDDLKSPERHVTIVGRVVDDRRMPVAVATARVLGDRFVAASGRTDGRGRFRIDASGREGGFIDTVHVSDGTRRAAVHRIPRVLDQASELDVGTLELEAATSLDVRVTAKGQPSAAAVLLWAGDDRPVASGVAGSDGRVRFDGVPFGAVSVYAQSVAGRVGRTTRGLMPDREHQQIDVELELPRVLEVLVVAEDSKPVPNAKIDCTHHVENDDPADDAHVSWFFDVPRVTAPPTGPDGRTRIEGLTSKGDYMLEAVAEGMSMNEDHDTVFVEPGVTSVTIHVKRQPVARFEIVKGELSAPLDGTRLRVIQDVQRGGEIGGDVTGGEVVVAGGEVSFGSVGFNGFAIAPDGSIAPLLSEYVFDKKGPQSRPTSFSRPRRLVVHVVGADGHPAAGIPVMLARTNDWEWAGVRPTNADGRATFEQLPPWEFLIHIVVREAGSPGQTVDRVDLSAGDAIAEVVIGAETTLVAHLLVDGVPALPSGLTWNLDEAVVLAGEEDPEAGVLRIRARSLSTKTAKGSVSVRASDFGQSVAGFDWPASAGTVSVTLPLGKPPKVLGQVRSQPGSLISVEMQVWSEDEHRWELRGDFPWDRGDPEPGRPNSNPRPLDLPSGRYRLRDRYSGMVSDPFEVRADAGRTDVVLDLTSLATVRGRVSVPDGASAYGARILVDGPGVDSSAISRPMHDYAPAQDYTRDPYADGSFVVPVPAGRKCTLRVVHPSLVPAKDGGSVEIEAPRDGVVLRLVEGPTVRIRPVGPEGAALSADAVATARLYLRSLRAEGTANGHELQPREGGALAATGLPTGDFDAWLDTPPFASRRFEAVHLGDEIVDLGVVRLAVGAALVIRLVAPKGVVVSDVRGTAILMEWPRSGDARYSLIPDKIERVMAAIAGDPERWRAQGLCAGRWGVHLAWNGNDGTQQAFDREVQVTGSDELRIEVPGK